MIQLIAIFVGGGLGSLARFGISKLFIQFPGLGFPYPTLVSNILSCAILAGGIYFSGGKFVALPVWRLFLITGFCGGFSTFSTFSFETFELIERGNYLFALMNILVSIVTCFGVIMLLRGSLSN